MPRICELCGKGYLKGNLVPRGVGDRVTRRTLTRYKANLRTKKLTINGTPYKVRLCTSCLRTLKKVAAVPAAVETASQSLTE